MRLPLGPEPAVRGVRYRGQVYPGRLYGCVVHQADHVPGRIQPVRASSAVYDLQG